MLRLAGIVVAAAAMVTLIDINGALAADAQGADPRAVTTAVLARLDAAWNAADGAAFAAEFTLDADIINIFGVHFQGRADIAKRMQLIFDTIFKGSTHRERTLEMTRTLSQGLILAVSSATVDVPSGPQAPRMVNRQTFVLVEDAGRWRIRHWHNTLVQQKP